MKCKGKCFDRQSGETGAISPEKVAGMDQRLLWREQLGRDSKSLEDFKLSSKPLLSQVVGNKIRHQEELLN